MPVIVRTIGNASKRSSGGSSGGSSRQGHTARDVFFFCSSACSLLERALSKLKPSLVCPHPQVPRCLRQQRPPPADAVGSALALSMGRVCGPDRGIPSYPRTGVVSGCAYACLARVSVSVFRPSRNAKRRKTKPNRACCREVFSTRVRFSNFIEFQGKPAYIEKHYPQESRALYFFVSKIPYLGHALRTRYKNSD